MPYWLICSNEELVTLAAQWDDQWETGSDGSGTVADFNWFRVLQFPTSLLVGEGGVGTWREFWDTEVRTWTDQGDSRRFHKMVRWWLTLPISDPITVVQGRSGAFCIWDGMHRTAISVLHGVPGVPAIVGVRK